MGLPQEWNEIVHVKRVQIIQSIKLGGGGCFFFFFKQLGLSGSLAKILALICLVFKEFCFNVVSFHFKIFFPFLIIRWF